MTSPRIIAVAALPWGQEFPVREDGYAYVGDTRVGDVNASMHTPDKCVGEACCFHNPSDHRLKNADMILRMDKSALIERVCEHGCGHDDPDSAAYLRRTYGWEWPGVHGCDGCC